MRSNLVNGKISQPASREAAERREQQLRYEMVRIEIQIADATRISRFPSEREYDRWKRRARASLGYMGEEARQLREWLDAPVSIFAEARDHVAQYPTGCPHADCDHPACVRARIEEFWSSAVSDGEET